jgi:hypothetical protein
VLSVTSVSIRLVLVLSIPIASVSIAAAAAVATSSTTILHSLDLTNCRIKRASTGRRNYGTRQNTVSHASGIGTHTSMLGLVHFQELLALSQVILLPKSHARITYESHTTVHNAITPAVATSVLIPATLILIHAVLSGRHLST